MILWKFRGLVKLIAGTHLSCNAIDWTTINPSWWRIVNISLPNGLEDFGQTVIIGQQYMQGQIYKAKNPHDLPSFFQWNLGPIRTWRYVLAQNAPYVHGACKNLNRFTLGWQIFFMFFIRRCLPAWYTYLAFTPCSVGTYKTRRTCYVVWNLSLLVHTATHTSNLTNHPRPSSRTTNIFLKIMNWRLNSKNSRNLQKFVRGADEAGSLALSGSLSLHRAFQVAWP
jgi:hypothetical protein